MSADFYRRLADHARLTFVDPPLLAEGTSLSLAAARAFRVVPLADDGETLVVATADPARADVAMIAALAGRAVRLVVAAALAIDAALDPDEAPIGAMQEPAAHAELQFLEMAESSFPKGLRGYRPAEVDAAIDRRDDELDRLRSAAAAADARAKAMQVEIQELHQRVDALRQREAEATRALEELRTRREQIEQDARAQAQQTMLEAQERATLLKTEGLRQVGDLQAQVEQLIGMRAGLSQALQRLSEDIAAALARIAAAPATAIDRPVEHHVERWARDS
jgi:cell division septum initiation protein DivIVA